MSLGLVNAASFYKRRIKLSFGECMGLAKHTQLHILRPKPSGAKNQIFPISLGIGLLGRGRI